MDTFVLTKFITNYSSLIMNLRKIKIVQIAEIKKLKEQLKCCNKRSPSIEIFIEIK